MNIHEYQGKQLFKQYGIPVSRGVLVNTVAEVESALSKLDSQKMIVVKSQIHAGGRGKGTFKGRSGGGVKLAKGLQEVKSHVENMLGGCLVTYQTGPEGSIVRKVYLEEGSDIEKEYYFSVILDRTGGNITFVASTEGGVDIEEVAENHPEKIVKVSVDPAIGYQKFHGRDVAYGLGFSGNDAKEIANISEAAYKLFVEKDAVQVEINPLIKTTDGRFIALDAKLGFDENALFKHKDIADLADEFESDPLEIEAAKHSLSYIKMDGNIGCMVNGAGLAMATMDIIKLYGGEPANFLDVGGSATFERVKEAFKIILSDKNVRGILVNIFGGIMRCNIIAEGVVAAVKDMGVTVPVVVRLEGTNVDQGKQILESSGLSVVSANDLDAAARKIVELSSAA